MKGSTYKEIIKGYHSFVNGIGSQVFIVFDGYLKSNTKDQTHEKRFPIQSLRIEITEDMTNDCSKDLFLSNPANKQQFLHMLGESLSSAGYKVTLHANDADVVLVDQVIELSKDRNVRVISNDTDVFALLLAKLHKSTPNSVYLRQPKAERTLNITSLSFIIPDQIIDYLLLIHAMSGCDIFIWHRKVKTL